MAKPSTFSSSSSSIISIVPFQFQNPILPFISFSSVSPPLLSLTRRRRRKLPDKDMSVAVPMPPAPSHRWDNEDQGPLLDSRTGTFIFFPDLGCVWLLRKIWGLGNCGWECRHRKEEFFYFYFYLFLCLILMMMMMQLELIGLGCECTKILN